METEEEVFYQTKHESLAPDGTEIETESNEGNRHI